MNTKIVAILAQNRDEYNKQADDLEKQKEADELALKAKNYKIRINRLRRMAQEVQSLITTEMQSQLDEVNRVEQEWPDWQTLPEMLEACK